MEQRGATRVGLVAGASLALALGLLAFLWWVARDEAERGPLALPASAAPAEVPAPPALAAPVLAAPPSLESRVGASGPRAGELERAVWVEGQVVFPPGTPADEAAFVLARGNKAFADGSLHRVPVAADGSFRVAFAERSKTGWLLLEARYAYLAENFRWKKDSVHPLLEPLLGGCLEGRVVPPEGEAGFFGGRVECTLSGEENHGLTPPPHVELRAERRFVFGGLAPGDARLSYEGGRLWAHELSVEVEAGVARSVELELRAGVVLGGRVLDGRSQPLAGVNVRASAGARSEWSWHTVQSARDGAFRFPCVPPGDVRLVASLGGHVDAELALSALGEGDARTDLVLVLGGGTSLAGRVTWPDGRPAWPGFVSVEADEPGASLRSASVFLDADGRFRIDGLGPGPFAVHVRARPVKAFGPIVLSSEWQAVARGVRADTTDLALVLGPEESVAASPVRVHGHVWIGGRAAGGAVLRGRARGSDMDAATCRSAADGSYSFELPAPGAYWIGVWDSAASVHAWLALEVPRATDLEHDLRLAMGRVSGRVSARDGSALAGVRVQANETSATSKERGWASAVSDAGGEYELMLPVATYELCAGGEGGDADPERSFVRALRPAVVVTSGSEQPGCDFVVELGAALAGRVRWSDGRPAVEAELWLRPRGRAKGAESLGKTDEDGRFEVESLAAGQYVVTAALAPGTAEWLEVELSAGGVRQLELVLE